MIRAFSFTVPLATLSVLTLLAAPMAASPLISPLHFPQENGTWGCVFYGNCQKGITPEIKRN